MEKKVLEFFSQLLTQWLEELLNRVDDIVEELLDSQENLADPLIELLLNRSGFGPFVSGTGKAY